MDLQKTIQELTDTGLTDIFNDVKQIRETRNGFSNLIFKLFSRFSQDVSFSMEDIEYALLREAAIRVLRQQDKYNKLSKHESYGDDIKNYN
jgi:hypothetical protein